MHIGREAGLGEREQWELYYTLLLKDLGCSSNAARICELYLTDDLHFKRDFKLVGDSLPQMLSFVFKHTGLKAGLADRLRSVVNIMRNGSEIAHSLIQTRCTRGADIARRLHFPDAVAQGIASLDEHWDGRGKPQGLVGAAIPLHARIALLSQVVDVFHTADGPEAALVEARRRAGSWFDPTFVRAFEGATRRAAFWETLRSPAIDAAVLQLEPGRFRPCASTRRTPRRSSDASSPSPSLAGYRPRTTSGWTVVATRAACAVIKSRSRPASSPMPTSSTPFPPSAPTVARCRYRARWK